MPEVYTHGHHESVLRSHVWRTAENSAAYLLPHLAPGLDLLDVGCGPGTITADLAALRRAGPGGRAGPRGGAAGPGPRDGRRARAEQRVVRRGGRLRAGLPGRVVRRGARASGAAASGRPGGGAAGDGPGDPAGRADRGARRRLRVDDLVPGERRAGPAGSSSIGRSRGATTPSRTPAASCWPGPTPPGSRDVTPSAGVWCYADAGGPGLVVGAVGRPDHPVRARRPGGRCAA